MNYAEIMPNLNDEPKYMVSRPNHAEIVLKLS